MTLLQADYEPVHGRGFDESEVSAS
jgi:hypothetical protein